MKRSKIICSIITVIYVVFSVALLLLLLKSNIEIKSSVSIYLKLIYIVSVVLCVVMYVVLKKRLAKKLSNKVISMTVSKIYYYVYLAVIVFISRFLMACVIDYKQLNFVPTLQEGLGSYINYVLGKAINNQLYVNVILNGIISFIICIIVKKIMLNISENDTVSTVTSICCILLPQSLVYVTEYIKYSYLTLVMLIGIYIYIKIIDEVKQFNKNNNKYLVYSIILGLVQALFVVLGGAYILWLILMCITAAAAMYVDSINLNIKFKHKLSYKFKRVVEKIEKTNVSKLVYVAIISLTILSISNLIYNLVFDINNYTKFNISNCINILIHSRNYYLVLIVLGLVFEIIGIVLKRKLDIKIFIVKVTMLIVGITTFFTIDTTYAAITFDVLLVLALILSICNICYNREEKIKLLKEKN